MILLTVGTQLPFDRLVRAVDEWAIGKSLNLIAQIGKTSYEPENINFVNFLEAEEMDNLYNKADLIISHAGMGTIITALKKKKKIVVLPRMKKFGEHRNDHQVATVNSFSRMGYITSALDVNELISVLDRNISICEKEVGDYASNELINYIKDFVNKG